MSSISDIIFCKSVIALELATWGICNSKQSIGSRMSTPDCCKAITDLQKLMSEIEDISCNNEWCHIKGKVPLNTSKDYASEVSSYTKGLGVFMVKPCGYQLTKGGYSDNIRMNEKDKLLFMFQKSMSSK